MTGTAPKPRLSREIWFFLPPLALVLGVFSGFHLDLPPQSIHAVPLLAAAGGFLRGNLVRNLILIVLASLLLGNQLCRQAQTESLAKLPPETAVGKSFKIRCRIRNQFQTRYGIAVSVDRVQILSPASAAFELDRLTLYTPDFDGVLERNRRMETWLTLGQSHVPQTFPHPMAKMRQRFFPRYHGNVKDMRLMDAQPTAAARLHLNQGNRELLALFLEGAPAHVWRERLAPFGLGHLLAISGLHCVLVYGLIQLLLLPLRRPLIRTTLAVIAIVAFAHWVGWTTSVTRASAMLILWQMLPNLNRRRSWFRLWAALLVIAVVSDPLVLLMRGFWYSFAASLGLILGGRLMEDNPLIHPLQRRLRVVLPILAAQLFVLPINLMFNCHTNLTGFFWNLLGAGFLAVLLLLLGLNLLALAVPILAGFANLSERMIAAAMNLFANWDPMLELVRFPYQPAAVLAVLIVLILCLRYGSRELRWYTAIAALIVGACFNQPQSGPQLVMFDVGQGACSLHVDEEGNGFLFDAGGKLPPGVNLSRLARLYGAQHLRGALISHLNDDHYNLMESVRTDLPVYVPFRQLQDFQNHPLLGQFPIHPLAKGDRFDLNGAQVSILWPDPNISPPNDNEDSLIALVEEASRRTLLTGDAGLFAEQHLDLPVDNTFTVLQAGHHGSKTATGSKFLARLKPQLVLISCGRKNRFRHPHKDVLNNLETGGFPVRITAEEGTITIPSRHSSGEVQP